MQTAFTYPPASPTASDLPPQRVEPKRFKTKMCRNFLRDGKCEYNYRCMFAHGTKELRTVDRNERDGLTTIDQVEQFQVTMKLRKAATSSNHHQQQQPQQRHTIMRKPPTFDRTMELTAMPSYNAQFYYNYPVYCDCPNCPGSQEYPMPVSPTHHYAPSPYHHSQQPSPYHHSAPYDPYYDTTNSSVDMYGEDASMYHSTPSSSLTGSYYGIQLPTMDDGSVVVDESGTSEDDLTSGMGVRAGTDVDERPTDSV